MTKEKRILMAFTILLLLFVGFLVFKTYSYNQAIKSQKEYLSQLNNSAKEQNTLTEPVITPADPQLGAKDAPITIVMFSSFTCPHCSAMVSVLDDLMTNYPKKVRLIWKDFVDLKSDRELKPSLAARCAQEQGKFWEYYRQLMSNQISLSQELFQTKAQETGLDLTEFNQCYNNQETLVLIYNDFQEGVALNVDATPYFFINNQRYSGTISYENLEKLINR